MRQVNVSLAAGRVTEMMIVEIILMNFLLTRPANLVSCENAKKSLMSWVFVIPKEGWTGPSFFWYNTDYLNFFFFLGNFFFSSRQRQRLRTLGTFLHTTAHIMNTVNPHLFQPHLYETQSEHLFPSSKYLWMLYLDASIFVIQKRSSSLS